MNTVTMCPARPALPARQHAAATLAAALTLAALTCLPPPLQAQEAAWPTPPRPARAVAAEAAVHSRLAELDKPAVRPAMTLRCWQGGRLIVERRVPRPPAAAASATRVANGSQPDLLVFGVNRALCLVE